MRFSGKEELRCINPINPMRWRHRNILSYATWYGAMN